MACLLDGEISEAPDEDNRVVTAWSSPVQESAVCRRSTGGETCSPGDAAGPGGLRTGLNREVWAVLGD